MYYSVNENQIMTTVETGRSYLIGSSFMLIGDDLGWGICESLTNGSDNYMAYVFNERKKTFIDAYGVLYSSYNFFTPIKNGLFCRSCNELYRCVAITVPYRSGK